MKGGSKNEKIVLVAVLKNQRDLDILLHERWYRIPVQDCPKLKFKSIAFYQPALFGKQGKQIKYYAEVLKSETKKRKDLLPHEPDHPRANEDYYQFWMGEIKELSSPVKNIIPRRVCFGFTTLKKLFKAKDILQIYGVAPTEQMIEKGLSLVGIKVNSQHYIIKSSKKRYRLDFAVFCKNGAIAIECDNKKAHSSKIQVKKDRAKNIFLRRHGWVVVRLSERKIIFDLPGCVKRVESEVKRFGGQGE